MGNLDNVRSLKKFLTFRKLRNLAFRQPCFKIKKKAKARLVLEGSGLAVHVEVLSSFSSVES